MELQKNKEDCSFIRNNLFAYQEKQLPDVEYGRFEDHLQSCDECFRIVSGFQSITSFIDEKKSIEPSPYLRTRILQGIESHLQHDRSFPDSVFLNILRPVSVFIFLLIGVIIGIFIVKPIEMRFSDNKNHQTNIQVMKSELNIPEFIDEDHSFFDNY